jgi:hypothetical protein
MGASVQYVDPNVRGVVRGFMQAVVDEAYDGGSCRDRATTATLCLFGFSMQFYCTVTLLPVHQHACNLCSAVAERMHLQGAAGLCHKEVHVVHFVLAACVCTRTCE